MRVRRGSDTVPPLDGSHQFMLGRLLCYVDRFLARYAKLDCEILQILPWLLGPEIVEEDLLPLATMLDTGEGRRRFKREMDEDFPHPRDLALFMERALRKARKDEQACVVGLLRGVLKKRLAELPSTGTSDVEKNLATLEQMFGLIPVRFHLYNSQIWEICHGTDFLRCIFEFSQVHA